jgi:putative ABC transport system ATP-binding protein
MAGLDTPTQGSVHVAGQNVFALNEDQRAALRAKHLGFVFQSFQLLAPLTAIENVMLPLELAGHPDPRPIAKDMLVRVGLAERLIHYPKVMSGGVVKPDVLLADEPTGSLDHATGEKVMQLMLELNKELGTTLVMVTHDRALSQRCDQRLVMEAGRAHLEV